MSNQFKHQRLTVWREATQFRQRIVRKDPRQLFLVQDFLSIPAFTTVLAMSSAFSWENYLRRVFGLMVITAKDLLVKISHDGNALPTLVWEDDLFRTVTREVARKLRDHVRAVATDVADMIFEKFKLSPASFYHGIDVQAALAKFDKGRFEKDLLPHLTKSDQEAYESIGEVEEPQDHDLLLVNFIHDLFSKFRAGKIPKDIPASIPDTIPDNFYESVGAAIDACEDDLDLPCRYISAKQLAKLKAIYGEGHTKTYGAIQLYYQRPLPFDVFSLIGSKPVTVCVDNVPVKRGQYTDLHSKSQEASKTADKATPPSSVAGKCLHGSACQMLRDLETLGLEKLGGPQRQLLLAPDPAVLAKINAITKQKMKSFRQSIKAGTYCEVYECGVNFLRVHCSEMSDEERDITLRYIIGMGLGSQYIVGGGSITLR